jgi:hypothetical protein
MQALTLGVVGVDYPNKRGPTRRFEIALCRPGDPVHLVPEPKNKFDERAVQVVSERGVVMGYVTAERAPLVGKMLSRHQVCAVFQEATAWGAVIRVGLDGEPPELPPAQAMTNQDQDWWPDEVYPDD